MKKKGFTLLEVIIAVTGFFLLMTVVFNAYIGVIKYRYAFQARAGLVENTYYMMEKVNLLLKDFTIDYEEYFNRRNVGCDSGYQANFLWYVGVNGYCDNFTAYGNATSTSSQTGNHMFYYCSSTTGYTQGTQYIVQNPGLVNGSGCFSSGFQSYGEYSFQFTDMKNNVDFVSGVVNDADDVLLGKGPNAVYNSTGVKELYLISQSERDRVFIRRVLVESGDWDGNGIVSGENEYRYTLQILKLKGFDAGSKHTFSPLTSSGVYDGTLDTWACDYAQGFICNGTGIGNVYSGYRLPSNQNDGWVNLFDKNITVTDWNIMVYPTKDPEYAWAEDTAQLNPYFTISLKTKLYGGVWQKRLHQTINNFEFALQTTFNTKNNYIKE